eukprot:TRINITY_DN29780_c1_g1_i3.p2 TRINITY_DN29780_c1_g1~~TRINITY_DN29780_c1_g1_i3.p2  ORF type:complete len:440 (-),score=24.71 TRINITY_DN29780_c1_g1_i3:171-1442(-)
MYDAMCDMVIVRYNRLFVIFVLCLTAFSTSCNAQWQYIYNVSTIQENQSNYPGIRYSHTAALSRNQMIISHGYYYNRGHKRPRWLSDTWAMDLSPPYSWHFLHDHTEEQTAKNWYQNNQKKFTPAGRFGLSSTVVIGQDNVSYLYIYGGNDGGYHRHNKMGYEKGYEMGEMWKLNLETLEWVEIQNQGRQGPGSRHLHAMTSVDNLIYVYGGLGTSKGDLWAFDTYTEQWQLLAEESNGPGSRVGARMVAIKYNNSQKGLLLFGGKLQHQNSTLNSMPNDVWWFDIDTKKWQRVQVSDAQNNSPTGRIYFGMTTDGQDNNGIAYIVGGSTSSPSMKCTTDTWVFSINCEGTQGTWTKLSDLPFGHYFQTVVLSNGEIFAFGGHLCSFTKGDFPYYYLNSVLKLSIQDKVQRLQLCSQVKRKFT